MKSDGREVWIERIQRWTESGLSAVKFAEQIGVNPHTLTGWKYRLSHPRRGSNNDPSPKFVEVKPNAAQDPYGDGFELVLSGGVRLRIPSSFDAGALRALLSALERR